MKGIRLAGGAGTRRYPVTSGVRAQPRAVDDVRRAAPAPGRSACGRHLASLRGREGGRP